MEEISTFIEILERAGIKYEVDQTMDEDGGSLTLEVYVYDNADRDSFVIFYFDAYNNEHPLENMRIARPQEVTLIEGETIKKMTKPGYTPIY